MFLLYGGWTGQTALHHSQGYEEHHSKPFVQEASIFFDRNGHIIFRLHLIHVWIDKHE